MRTKSIFIAVVIFSMLLNSFFVCQADENVNNISEIITSSNNSNNDYAEYYAGIADYKNATKEYKSYSSDWTLLENTVASLEAEYSNEKNVLLLQEGKFSYKVIVDENAIYNVFIKYKVINKDGLDAKIGLQIDGKTPFEQAAAIEIPCYWENATDIRSDDFGNEFAPEQSQYDGFVKRALYDRSGIVLHPYEFAFSKGEHEITIEMVSGAVAFAEISLLIPDNSSISYSQVKETYKSKGYKEYGSSPIKIEGEDADLKNTNDIVPESDTSSKVLSPSSAKVSVINSIGGKNWKNSTDEIVWNIDIPESALYKLGMSCKQDQLVNGLSYRHLRIDGYTPFAEASAIAIDYDTDWQFCEFSDSKGTPYLFYLEKGTHELSLSVTLGPQADFYSRLKNVAGQLGDFYIDVVMITGESPDVNRDYELFKQIPEYYELLNSNYEELMSLVKDVQKLTGENGSNYIAAMRNMARVLKQMHDNSYTADEYVKDFYSNFVTLNSWLYEMTVMPLSIDQIIFAAPSGEFENKKVSWYENIWYGVQRFIYSFVTDYNSVKEETDESESIKIWVNWGRDQAQVLSSLIEESFTPSTGIKVNLEIVNADIVKGILSDTQPDLALHLPRATPVNLAMRGALYDLSNFDDYEEIMQRFGDSAGIPYQYNGGNYALPDQQSFYLMFYRTDILDELNIDVPKTWDEFLAATAVLQRNNMNSYIPYTKIVAATTVDTGIGGLNLFASILMQHNGKFYNDELNASQLTSNTSLNAFEYWTNFYTQYKLPTEADFYNRFRVGTCPLGISIYTQYTTFLQAAPEIQDRWGIALVPGIEQEDGSINRTVSGSGTGCSILTKSKNKDAAWEFLKWWTSSDIQTRYNSNVESILGAIARTTTANVDAFARMGWEASDLEILLAQREQIMEIPEVPGSYYLTRAVDQAYWNVINGKSSIKDSLNKWGKEANIEIARKIDEYQGEKS